MTFTARSLHEYMQLFGLKEADLKKSFIDVAAGLSSFNAELTQLGGRVVSIDVLYDQCPDIVRDITASRDETPEGQGQVFIENQRELSEKLSFLKRKYSAAAKLFLKDYAADGACQRYRWALLPNINFQRNTFDIALSSHFLFYEGKNYTKEFHMETIQNMVDVAYEARIAPLVCKQGQPARHVDEIVNEAVAQGLKVRFEESDFGHYADNRILVLNR